MARAANVLPLVTFDRARVFFLAKDRVLVTFRPGARAPELGQEFLFQAVTARYRLLPVARMRPLAGRRLGREESRLVATVLAANRCESCRGAGTIDDHECPACGGGTAEPGEGGSA